MNSVENSRSYTPRKKSTRPFFKTIGGKLTLVGGCLLGLAAFNNDNIRGCLIAISSRADAALACGLEKPESNK